MVSAATEPNCPHCVPHNHRRLRLNKIFEMGGHDFFCSCNEWRRRRGNSVTRKTRRDPSFMEEKRQ
jgi:hypothetical protein